MFKTTVMFDMYPLYWTTSKEGIFMRYSYEFKMMCVELYHSGSYPDIPEGLNPNTLKRHIREWSRLVDLHGPEVLKHKVFNKVWTPEEKLELISKVIAGTPRTKVAENEVIKKRIALRQEKWVAQLKAKKQQSSKNSEKKDIN